MVSVASPTKAREFVEAQNELPMSMFYCSQDREAYQKLGFYDNFGSAGGALQAALLPLQKIRDRGADQLKFMRDKTSNYAKLNPIGLVSGQAFSIEDAKAATQLGGGFAVKDGMIVYAHRDKAVADHLDMEQVLRLLGA